jgi:hypothetical protein
VVRAGGGASAVRRCGSVATGPFQVTALAWRLDVPIGRVGLRPHAPGSLFRAGPQPRPIPGAPPIGVKDRRFHTIARAQSWQVVATCG